jgi:hypothetical protein
MPQLLIEDGKGVERGGRVSEGADLGGRVLLRKVRETKRKGHEELKE